MVVTQRCEVAFLVFLLISSSVSSVDPLYPHLPSVSSSSCPRSLPLCKYPHPVLTPHHLRGPVLLDPQRLLFTFPNGALPLLVLLQALPFLTCTAYFTKESFLLFCTPMGQIKLLSCLGHTVTRFLVSLCPLSLSSSLPC